MNITEQAIRGTAQEVLMLHNHNVKNRCDGINNEILCRIEESIDQELPSAKPCTVKGSSHYVALIPAEVYDGVERDDGNILFDATLTQFQHKFEQQIPDVVIIEDESAFTEFYDI